MVPVAELLAEISLVHKASLFEERSLDEADQVFDRTLLLRPVRPADLDADPECRRDLKAAAPGEFARLLAQLPDFAR